MTDHDGSTATSARRGVPVLTLALMIVAVLCPLVPFAMSSLGREGQIGVGIFAQPVLGIIGGVFALRDRSLTEGTRIGWAIVSVLVGILLVPAWWVLLVVLLGP